MSRDCTEAAGSPLGRGIGLWGLVPDLPGCEIPDDGEAVQLASIGIDHADDSEAEGQDAPDCGKNPADKRDPAQDSEDQAHASEEHEGLEGMKTNEVAVLLQKKNDQSGEPAEQIGDQGGNVLAHVQRGSTIHHISSLGYSVKKIETRLSKVKKGAPGLYTLEQT